MSGARRASTSIGAVLAGLATVFVLSLGMDALLHASGVFPPFGERMSDPLFLLATAYRIVYGVAGSWVSARLAPDRPMGHALALGFVGLVFSIAGAAATWNRGPEFGPHWYALAVAAQAIPCAWAGGALRQMQLHSPALGGVA